LLAIIFYISARLLGSPVGRFLTGSPAETNPDHPWILRSYILAGVSSAMVHLFTVITALRRRNPDANLVRLFVPTWERLAAANTLPVNTAASKAVEFLEQFHLFSQFDWMVVSLVCVVFTHLLLCRACERTSTRWDGNPRPGQMSDVGKRDLGLLLLGTIVLGPGPAGSFGLAVRESRLRQQWNRSRKFAID
jgi:hypothetical protein